MSAATVIAPLSYGQAVELANGIWAKRVLPVGSISYQGRQLHFTPDYLRTLENAFRAGAYDQVSFQLADSKNTHTNDPERHRGSIVDMKAQADGLYVYVKPTPRGAQVLRENPNLGVSARIVEEYSRADGKHFPAAIQHVLGTLDPRVTGLGPWTELANDGGGMIIDLSGSQFPGDAPPAYADPLDELIDGLDEAEQMDLLEAIYTASGGELPGEDGELSDAELDELVAQYEAEGHADDQAAALAGFEAAFAASSALDATRRAEDAERDRQMKFLPSDELRLSRALDRIQAGTYTPGWSHAAAELANAGAGTCGTPDPVTGLCINTGHQPGCRGYLGSDGDDVNLADSGAYVTALAELGLPAVNGAGVLEMSGDRPRPGYSQRTVELARAVYAAAPDLADAGGPPLQPSHGWDELDVLTSATTSSGHAYSDMAALTGHEHLAAPQPQRRDYPDVSALRAGLGL